MRWLTIAECEQPPVLGGDIRCRLGGTGNAGIADKLHVTGPGLSASMLIIQVLAQKLPGDVLIVGI